MKVHITEEQAKQAVAEYLVRVLHCRRTPKVASIKLRRKSSTDETVGTVVVEIEEEQ